MFSKYQFGLRVEIDLFLDLGPSRTFPETVDISKRALPVVRSSLPSTPPPLPSIVAIINVRPSGCVTENPLVGRQVQPDCPKSFPADVQKEPKGGKKATGGGVKEGCQDLFSL